MGTEIHAELRTDALPPSRSLPFRRAATVGLTALVEGRIVVGVAAAAITGWTATILRCPVGLPLLASVCAATIIIYDLDRLFDRRGAVERVPLAVRATLVVACALLGLMLPLLQLETTVALLAGLPLCALYCVPAPRWNLFSSLAGTRPKDHPAGKALFVACAVTTATLLLPWLEARGGPDRTPIGAGRLLLAGVWVFAVILVNALACDLRDHASDLAARLRTVPTSIGASRTRAIVLAGNVTIFVATAIAVAIGAVPAATLIPLAIAAIALVFLSEADPRWLWGLAIDGAFLPLLTLLS